MLLHLMFLVKCQIPLMARASLERSPGNRSALSHSAEFGNNAALPHTKLVRFASLQVRTHQTPKMPTARRTRLRYPRLKLAYFNKLINLTMARLFRTDGLDVTREQEAILRELVQGDGISQVELATRTGQDRNNLSRTLDLLVGKGLACRQASSNDRRQSLVFLTKSGKELESAAYEAVNEYREILFRGFNQQEIDAFAAAIERLTSNLETFLEDPSNAR